MIIYSVAGVFVLNEVIGVKKSFENKNVVFVDKIFVFLRKIISSE